MKVGKIIKKGFINNHKKFKEPNIISTYLPPPVKKHTPNTLKGTLLTHNNNVITFQTHNILMNISWYDDETKASIWSTDYAGTLDKDEKMQKVKDLVEKLT